MGSAVLHFVEGLPGAGKSTFANLLTKQILLKNKNVVYYKEETSQPVDLFRQAIIPKALFGELIKSLSVETIESINSNLYYLCEYIVVAYTKVLFTEEEYRAHYQSFRKYDIGEGRVSFDKYKQYHYELWKAFVREYGFQQRTCIAEGAFLHNQLLDIIGFYDVTVDEVVAYYSELAEIISPVKKTVYLILPDNIERLISSTLLERGTELHSWGDGFAKWMEYSPFCKRNKLSGESGMKSIYLKLELLSIEVLNAIGWDYKIIRRNIYKY